PYFIWLYNADPTRFLKMKVIRATTQMTLLILPMAVLLIMVFPAQFLPVFLCLLVGLLFHVLFVLLKYAVYPRIFTVPDLILLMFRFALPVIFPFILYRSDHTAKNNLSHWLYFLSNNFLKNTVRFRYSRISTCPWKKGWFTV